MVAEAVRRARPGGPNLAMSLHSRTFGRTTGTAVIERAEVAPLVAGFFTLVLSFRPANETGLAEGPYGRYQAIGGLALTAACGPHPAFQNNEGQFAC